MLFQQFQRFRRNSGSRFRDLNETAATFMPTLGQLCENDERFEYLLMGIPFKKNNYTG
jgi:hypothetical protein